MKRVFADTSFYVAILNVNDVFHTKADAFAAHFTRQTITTEYVIVELGNWLSRASSRGAFAAFVEDLHGDAQNTIVPAESALLPEGIRLYARRQDKTWSLTDCISFVVMEQFRLEYALASDHHFEQAGFEALLV